MINIKIECPTPNELDFVVDQIKTDVPANISCYIKL